MGFRKGQIVFTDVLMLLIALVMEAFLIPTMYQFIEMMATQLMTDYPGNGMVSLCILFSRMIPVILVIATIWSIITKVAPRQESVYVGR